MNIFLDIDGVMVPANSWRAPELMEDGFPKFTNKSVQTLNELINRFDADIILTTSHKSSYNLIQWNDILKKRNIHVKNISRLPDNNKRLNRKDELLNWFDNNSIGDDFVIIDDDKSLNELPAFYKEKLISTRASIGLTEANLENPILVNF